MTNICHNDDTLKNLDNPTYDCANMVATSSDSVGVQAGCDNVPGGDYEYVDLSPNCYNSNGDATSKQNRKQGRVVYLKEH